MTDSNFVIKKGLDIFDGDISLKGVNKELRFYEGANYVGFEAPALTADKIWVLPNADGTTGQALKTDGSGNLGWADAGGDTNAGGVDGSASAPTFSFASDSNNGLFLAASDQPAIAAGSLAVMQFGVLGGVHLMNNNRIRGGSGSAGNPTYGFIDDGRDNGMYKAGTDILGFSTAGTERMTISASGVVNIAGSLTVAGSAVGGGGADALNDLTDVISNTTNFTDSILISPDGAVPPHGTLSNAHSNVGIGKDALAAVTSGSSNVALGFNAMKSFTTGYKAVAIGYRAMDTTTAVAQGVAIGADAGRNMTATNAVVIGAVAGTNLTTGAGSVFIGEAAGYGVTTESHNIAIGSMALSSGNLSGATYNIGLGSFVGYDITSGDYNIGIGAFSLRELESGSSNLMFGKNAGMNITTGNRNIGIGTQSYDGANTESDNIAIGYDALGGSVNGGEQNVVIGNNAGELITSADGSVIIGHNAGTAVNTGNYNTLLGFEAGAQMTSGYANVAIGRQANRYGNGNDSIAIGFASLSNADLAGDRNIGIGYSAGNNITSGDGNVVIGNADVASASGDNQLSISSNSASSPVTWITGNSNGFVTHANGSDHTFAIFGEEGDLYAGTGSTGNSNGYQFSYGNGKTNVTQASNGTDFGINVPHNCVLERIDVVFGNSGNVNSGTTTFVVVKNGSNQSGNLSTNHTSGIHDTHHTGLSYAFTNGDRFNLRTTTSSRQVGPMRMTARFRRTG